ncbi:MAG: exosortase/archaeosortase family protein [Thermoplasmatota archaeon]
MPGAAVRAWRPAAGMACLGYAILSAVGLLPHESPWVAVAAGALGLLLTSGGLSQPTRWHRGLVAALGTACAAGVVAYKAARHAPLGATEWCLVGYGVALLLGAFHLERRVAHIPVRVLVGWSFPLLLGPLALFAAASMALAAAPGATTPLLHGAVVLPAAWILGASGTPARVAGDTLILPVAGGTLALGVGLVCSGLYPMALFAGLLAHHVASTRPGARRALLLFASGMGGLWAVNQVRLVLLAHIGQAWGAQALQGAHAQLGWLLFVAFAAIYWRWALGARTAPQP